MSDPAVTLDLVLTGVRSRAHLLYASSYLRHLLESQAGLVRLTVRPTGAVLGDGPAGEAAVRALLVDDPRLLVQFSDLEHAWPIFRGPRSCCASGPRRCGSGPHSFVPTGADVLGSW